MWSSVAAATMSAIAAAHAEGKIKIKPGAYIMVNKPSSSGGGLQDLFGRLIGTALILSPIALLGWIYLTNLA